MNSKKINHKDSILSVFIDSSRFTYLMMTAVVILGLFSLFNLDIESNPEINQPIGIVQTFYPNSGPLDVETSVTKPLEEEIAGLSQLKEITSNSTNNISTITVNFESSADPKTALDNLREAVNNASSKLPSEAETPRVIELDFNAQSILTLSLTGNRPQIELSKTAEEIADRIERIPGVSKTEITGDVEEIVKVVLDPIRLEAFGISVSEVISTLNASNLNAPLGAISKDSEELSLRLVGKIKNIDELANTPIRAQTLVDSASFLSLKDVAEIELSSLTQKTESLVSNQASDPETAVTINVFKSKGGNIINIVEAVEAEIEKINPTLANGVQIIKTNDNAFFIKNDISSLSGSGLQTIIIIFFALMLFLTAREALVASIAVPVIFLMTFVILFFSGQTLNGLTIFSLILSLGLIVDTSIVIVEGIHEYRNQGFTKTEAAKMSLATYKTPLIAGTLTTLSAFAPMLLVGGIVGEYIKTIPIVLSVTLFSSLFVSFIFTPLLGSKILKADNPNRVKSSKEQTIYAAKELYKAILEYILDFKLIQRTIVICTIVLFLLSMTLPITGVLKAQLFPVTDTPFIYINVETATGTSLEGTKQLAAPIISELNSNSAIKNYVFNLGTQIDLNGAGLAPSTKSNYGHFIINLIDDENERPKSFEVSADFREKFENLANIEVTIVEVSAGPPSAAPVDIKIVGPDLDELESIAKRLKSEFENIDGIVNVATDFDNLSDEINLVFDQEKLRLYGMTNQQVALGLQAYTNGIDTGKIEILGKDYEIKVFQENSETKDIYGLESLLVNTPLGTVPISFFAELNSAQGLQFIPRSDQERSTRVTGELNEGLLFADVKPLVDEVVANFELQDGYRFDLGGEDADIQESFRDLFSSMFIAILLIIVILVVQFNSYRQTFLILFTIPFAVIGIFPGLAIMGLPLSFPAFLGIVMLSGIVVNDAIVMIDQINFNRQEGLDITQSILEACSSRLVPILLTTITTTFGLLPLTLTDEFWEGLGYTVIFGLLTATLITLIVIPILYKWLYRKEVTTTQIVSSDSTPLPDPFETQF